MVTSGGLREDEFGTPFVEQGPGHGHRSREPVSSVAMHSIAREQVFGKESQETDLVDFADVRSHGVVVERSAVVGQANRWPPRTAGE